MDRDERRRSLEERARERARQIDGSHPGAAEPRRPPRPGDLFALAETADFGIEWLVLDRADVPSRVLLVPVDTNPLAGSADVEMPPSHPLGPLTLRCGYGVWIDPGGLQPADRTGVLDDETLEAALKKRWALARESLRGSPLEREVDVDPEYEDWVDEILIPARQALEEAHQEVVEVRTEEASHEPLRLAWGIAATLLFALVGLSLWTMSLYEQAQRSHEPEVLAQVPQGLKVGDAVRGDGDLRIRESDLSQGIYVVLGEDADPYSTFRLQIVSEDNGRRWTGTVSLSEPEPGVSREILLRLPMEFVGADRKAVLKLFGIRDGEDVPIDEEELRLLRESEHGG